MESLNITTTQNIDLEFNKASIGDRIFAYGFDILIMASYLFVCFFVFGHTSGNFDFWQILLTIPIAFYSLFCELIFNGQTIGKMVFKINVIKADGSEMTFADCLIRWIMRLVDIWLNMAMVGILAIILSENSQRVGDMLAKTNVIKLLKNDSFNKTSYIDIPNNYTPSYIQATNLNDEDIRIIKEVLKIHQLELSNLNKRNGSIFLNKTFEAIKIKLGITEINEPPKIFLETLVKDYNYYHG